MLPRLPLECMAQVADAGHRPVGTERDVDDVEAAPRLAETPPLQVMASEERQAPTLGRRDRRARGIAPAGPAGFHFDEHPHVAFSTHQVELAESRAHVPLDHLEATADEVRGGGVLSSSAAPAPGIHHVGRYTPGWDQTRCPRTDTAQELLDTGVNGRVGEARRTIHWRRA